MRKLCVCDTNIALVWMEVKWICCLLTDNTIGGLTSSSYMLSIFTKLTCTYKYITFINIYMFYVQMHICTYIACDVILQLTVQIFPTYPYIFNIRMNLHYARCWYFCCFPKFCFWNVFLPLFLLFAFYNMYIICMYVRQGCTKSYHIY
jgi:hypothetical protein